MRRVSASSSRLFFLLFLSVSVSNGRFEVKAEEALTEDNGELGVAKQFNPSRNDARDNQEVHMYYGSFGGASNCENCLVKARWLAETLQVDTLHVPACKRKPGDERQFPTMNPMEYFDERSLRSCNSESAFVLAMDGGDGDAYDDSSLSSPFAYSFNVESLGRKITADAVNGMPCFELVEGWCEIEKHRLGEYLIPKHKYKVEWKVVTSNLEEAKENAGPGKEIYFAGMYDFEPVDPKTGKKYPNVWQKEAQRYVKGETEKLGWADEAVEKRRRERDAARAKKAAEAKEKHFNKDRRDKNNDIGTFGSLPTKGETLGRAVNQRNIPRRDMFLAREQRIRQQQLQAEHQLSEETFREAWNENVNSNANRRRARNLLAFSSIEPCYSNGNLNDEIYEEANKEIEKLKIEPSDTLCVHWRQEDFLWKRIGNDFVKNVSYAAERIIHRAEASKLKTVLLLTNDPEVYPDDKRYDGRVAVNTLRGMLHEIGGLRVEWSMHRNEPDKSKAIYIDKATCSMMVDFIGTGKSSFTATIMDMRQTHELCLIDDPKDARLGRKSNRSINSKEGNALITTGEKSASPGFKYKMCLKEQYGGVSRNHRSPFIFPSDEFEHPIQAVETLLDLHTKTPSTNDDDDSDDDDGDEIDLRGGPEVVDEYLAEKEIKTFKSKEKKIEPEVEKINHDEYVREYQEENQQSNAMKEFSVLDPSISSEDLKLDLRELDDDASVECDRCYAAMPQSEVATPNAEIWLTTPSCEKCGVQLLRVQKQRANQGSEKKKKK